MEVRYTTSFLKVASEFLKKMNLLISYGGKGEEDRVNSFY